MEENSLRHAYFAAGCFWCYKPLFKKLRGVHAVEVGYAGGEVENPTYEQVATGNTGHAECAHLTYDPAEISYKQLLRVFWRIHDPTTLNRQGDDVGTQYRSAIFYTDDKQRQRAEDSKQMIQKSGLYKDEIVTEIAPLKAFYKAEDYHQKYYENNKQSGYCQLVIQPKVEKFEEEFADLLG